MTELVLYSHKQNEFVIVTTIYEDFVQFVPQYIHDAHYGKLVFVGEL